MPDVDPELAMSYAAMDNDTRAYVNLYRAVVCQALRDLNINPYRPDGSIDDERMENKVDAATWWGTSDFETVCELALINPGPLLSEVRSCMQRPEPYRRLFITRLADRINQADLHVKLAEDGDLWGE